MALFSVIVAPPIAQAEPSTTPATVGTVCFSANADGNWDLFRCRPDGRELARLTRTPVDERSCRLSPDGRRLAYATSAGKLGLCDLHAKTARPLKLPGGPYDHPAWFADGRRLLVTRYEITAEREDSDLCVCDVAGRRAVVEIRQTGVQAWGVVSSTGPLAYVSNVVISRRKGGQAVYRTLWLAVGDEIRPLRRLGLGLSGIDRPAWRPDGRALAFLASDGRQWSVFCSAWPELTSSKRLVTGVARDAGFCWSPDGKAVLFCRDDAPGVLFCLALATKRVQRIRPFGDKPIPMADPDWR